MESIPKDELFTASELSERYQICEKTLYRFGRDGVIPTEKFGKAVRFHLLKDKDGNPIEYLLTATQIAEKLKMNKQTVYKMCREGNLEYIRLGGVLVRFAD